MYKNSSTLSKASQSFIFVDDRKLLEEHQNLLLVEESEFLIEDDVGRMSLSRSKRPRLDNGVDGQDESVPGLKRKVSKLVEELSVEKAKGQELQKLNQTLQKSEQFIFFI